MLSSTLAPRCMLLLKYWRLFLALLTGDFVCRQVDADGLKLPSV